MLKKLFILSFILLSSVYASTAAAFLDNGIAARSDALSGAFTGVADDLDAFYYNPAGFGFQSKMRLNTATTRLNEVNDVYYAGFGAPFLGGYSAVNYYMTVVPDIPETIIVNGRIEDTNDSFEYSSKAVFLSHAVTILPNLSIGGNLKYIKETLMRNSAVGYGADIGLLYRWDDSLRIGASILNVLEPVMTWDTDSKEKNNVERREKIGLAYFLAKDILLTGDVTIGKREMLTALGCEYTLFDILSLRAGTQTHGYSLGLGLNYASCVFDFAYVIPEDTLIEATQKVSFGYTF